MMVDAGMVDTVVDLRLLRADVDRLLHDVSYILELLDTMTRALAPMVLEYQNERVRVMGACDSGVMFG
jgi:hypothetical protein